MLTKLLLNPASKVYLRGLEKELGVSSNTVRLELNKLSDMQLIEVEEADANAKVKHYTANTGHPLFTSLRNIILKHVGLDQILEQVIAKLGDLDQVYLTGDLAQGKNSHFIDLVIVGDIDKVYLHKLIDKVEPLIEKKIRVALFTPGEFREEHLQDMGVAIDLLAG
ncbi:MAG: ArsR family transcriptional regulator [Chitinophagaceae bacterium]|nr:ArsR family transcriptional regulator [Chitinophagaceae bacterium]MCA6456325.1 ArsR family transcriptional regulator [Chitinophagaceae bacterium]MCA6459685.1 ArsR family transcriptional regulator [Chitinophagaceae bacterium]MCA6464552.1 ArsR family transcriptional regulator [Chitinophagaceae bacterium]